MILMRCSLKLSLVNALRPLLILKNSTMSMYLKKFFRIGWCGWLLRSMRVTHLQIRKQIMRVEEMMMDPTVAKNAKPWSSNPDLRFIPKIDAKQAPKVKPNIHISIFKLIRIIRFLDSLSWVLINSFVSSIWPSIVWFASWISCKSRR